MRYANVLLILFLCAISFASESAPLRFAAAEMPKPDPCLPFITETYKWVEKHWPDGATFRYYDVTSLEKAVQNREIDIVLTEAGAAARLRISRFQTASQSCEQSGFRHFCSFGQ